MKAPGLGFPICRLVGVTCLSSGALLNAAMKSFHGKGASEQTLLRSMLDTFSEGDVMLGDAFYATGCLLAELCTRGVDALYRATRIAPTLDRFQPWENTRQQRSSHYSE